MSKIYPCIYCTDDLHCTKYIDPSDETYESWCVLGPCKDETPSNADRIRSMTDEELAEFIYNELAEPGYGITTEHWLNWLRKEAEQ